MLESIVVALGAAIALVLLARPLARRLDPQLAVICLSVAAVAGAGIWLAALSLTAAFTIGRLPLVAELGHWSAAVIAGNDSVPTFAGWGSAAVLALTLAGLLLSLRRLCAGVRQLWRMHHLAHGQRCGRLVIVPAANPEALALPGFRGSVVVTSGMLAALDGRQRKVLLAHEECHLRSQHWIYRLAVRAAAAAFPLARPLVHTCDQALERWADETAACEVGDRPLTARALAAAALAGTDHARSSGLVAAFSDSGVAARVAALLEPAPARRWSPMASVLALTALASVAIALAERRVEGVFEIASAAWKLHA